MGLDGREVHDRPTLGGHQRHRGAHEMAHAVEVFTHQGLLALGVQVQEVRQEATPGIVDQDVDTAEALADPTAEVLDVRLFANVEHRRRHGTIRMGRRDLCHQVGQPFLVAVTNGQVGPEADERQRRRPSDPGGGAGHDGDPSAE